MIAAVLAGCGGGALVDLRTRRVPNALTAVLAVAGVLLAALGASGLSVAASLAGCAIGLLLMLPGHLIGATGAGDVKLFAAAGALLGPAHIATAFVYTALAGGGLALLVAAQRRRLRVTIDGTSRLIASAAANAVDIESPHSDNRFAYAPAIAIGALAAALGM